MDLEEEQQQQEPDSTTFDSCLDLIGPLDSDRYDDQVIQPIEQNSFEQSPILESEKSNFSPSETSSFFPTFSFPELSLPEEDIVSDSMSGYYSQHMDVNPFCGLVNMKWVQITIS